MIFSSVGTLPLGVAEGMGGQRNLKILKILKETNNKQDQAKIPNTNNKQNSQNSQTRRKNKILFQFWISAG